jgi:hypothetical protein
MGEHSIAIIYEEATCTESGYRYEYCEICQTEFVNEYYPPTGHWWEPSRGYCSLCMSFDNPGDGYYEEPDSPIWGNYDGYDWDANHNDNNYDDPPMDDTYYESDDPNDQGEYNDLVAWTPNNYGQTWL